ncbi:MAG: RidA family protein, partial [Leptospiraceae bacterium]|nr:RidA family protein [Leptospiraceae bacterium]
MEPTKNLAKLGINLPPIPKALASYVPAKRIGNLIFTSGQVPIQNGGILNPGIVGKTVTLEQAGESCKLACLNALAAIISCLLYTSP